MSLSEKYVSLEELCAAIDKRPDWVRRHHRRLSRQHGMPEKSPLGWVWPRKALERWIDGENASAPASLAAATLAAAKPGSDLVANQNQRLRNRYAGRAGA